MKTVRRLYFYAVALISAEVMIWGLISLLRSMISNAIGGTTEQVAQALALTVVGLPFFLFHWLWAQRSAHRDVEERSAGLRGVFLYGMLLATLIPAVQQLLALINRSLLAAFRMETIRALLGGTQTAPDNLIAIAINGLLAMYFWYILRGDWKILPDTSTLSDVRRLYRYVWVVYGLGMTVFGVQRALRFLFFMPAGVLGELTRSTAIDAIALMVVGLPLWAFTWNTVQSSLRDPAEQDSNLRLGILYVLSLGGVVTVLTTTATVLYEAVRWALGSPMSAGEFINAAGPSLSIGIPLGAVWAYFGGWLNNHIGSIAEPVRQSGMRRVYLYILSAIGLGGTILGIAFLDRWLVDELVYRTIVLNEALRASLAGAICIVVAWIPLWVVVWRRLQAQAADTGDAGDHARRSILRRAYLYLALFAGVIGSMASAVAGAFQLFKDLLRGHSGRTELAWELNCLQLVIVFAIVLVYHLRVMQRDGRSTAASLARKHSAFRLLVLEGAAGFVDAVKAAMAKVAPNISITVAGKEPDGIFDATILAGTTALNPPPWLGDDICGMRIIVPQLQDGVHWVGGVEPNGVRDAAIAVRQLAEGQGLPQRSGGPRWMPLIYVAAALFALEIIFTLTMFVVSTLVPM